jgi:hypothetical protein
VQTLRSARHGRPEGLHYSDFFTAAPVLRKKLFNALRPAV